MNEGPWSLSHFSWLNLSTRIQGISKEKQRPGEGFCSEKYRRNSKTVQPPSTEGLQPTQMLGQSGLLSPPGTQVSKPLVIRS
ncbi:Caspase Recruitment Domain-Containing Protein 19 [Manis pentadactyla]|nr:Caspase Recruitment Domain-Containing Protein 19 [Manis pentadactyla]